MSPLLNKSGSFYHTLVYKMQLFDMTLSLPTTAVKGEGAMAGGI